MRIELPPPSWADTAHRAEDDAHTLTVASHPAPDWVQWQLPTEPAARTRTALDDVEAVTVTITF